MGVVDSIHSQKRDNPAQAASKLFCLPVIVGIIALYLIFELASTIAGGSTLGGIVLIGLVCCCIYRCKQNKEKGKGCNPC